VSPSTYGPFRCRGCRREIGLSDREHDRLGDLCACGHRIIRTDDPRSEARLELHDHLESAEARAKAALDLAERHGWATDRLRTAVEALEDTLRDVRREDGAP